MFARDAVRRALQDALAFVLPVDCAGCSAPDTALCEECRGGLRPRPRRVPLDAAVPLHAGLAFEGVTARVMRALKEEGRTALARDLAPALAAAVAHAGVDGEPFAVVPVPTSRASMRRRGYRVVEVIARRAGFTPQRLLRLVRQPVDQRGLAATQRRENMASSMVARSAAGRRILVVDDVSTTGATLAEAVRALRHAGAEVVGAAVVAATPRRQPGGTGSSEPWADASETHG